MIIYPRNSTQQFKIDTFINKATLLHNGLYDYREIDFIDMKTKIKIICKIHDPFYQAPSKHLNGQGCTPCGRIALQIKQSTTLEKFIESAKNIHEELYNYDLVEYVNNRTKIKIICKIHGMFEQTPNNHLKHGCNKCAVIIKARKLALGTEEFTRKAKDIHGELYNYIEVKYINAYTKVKIICNKHGEFKQSPAHHLKGVGCPDCGNNISKISTKWLESLNISDMIYEYGLTENIRKRVDGYSPSTNTVYQFHGDYWHGNPKRFNPEDINKTRKQMHGELYKKTIESDNWIRSCGYTLITMWESDYIQLK